MADNSFPYNASSATNPDRSYNANHVALYDQGVFSDGVLASDNQLAVTAGTGMHTEMDSGFAVIRGRRYYNDAPLTFEHDPADGVLNRIDRIILRESVTDRSIHSFVLKGTAGASPVAPTLADTTDVREISVARVLISAGVTSITADKITDERTMVTLGATLDTTTFDAQGQAAVDHVVAMIADAEGGSIYELKPIVATDLTIDTADFVSYTASGDAETNLYAAGYIKRAPVPVTGVLSTMRPKLTFDVTTVNSANVDIPNQFATYNGGVYVYSNGTPTNDIIILVAEFGKAVS